MKTIFYYTLVFLGSLVFLNAKKPLIITTISPYHRFIKEIVQDECDVETLIPTSQNPHDFEPTIKQMQRISQANIWFCIGESFEKQVYLAIKHINPSILIIDLCENLSLIDLDHHKHGKDRHVWLSPKLLSQQIQLIEKILTKRFPKKKSLFVNQTKEVLSHLTQLNLQLQNMLKPLKGKILLVAHPDFTYFCKDYSLKQVSIENDKKNPGSRYLNEILQQLKQKKIRILIQQPQYSYLGAKTLSQKSSIPITTIDPFSEDYYNNLITIANHLQKAYDNSN